MRTKTLILSALLGLMGGTTSSLMAQTNVYSLNAVGYINVVAPVGFSIIANQLNSTNNNITNLFQNGTVAVSGPMNGYAPYDAVALYVFQPGGHYETFFGDSGNINNGYWDGNVNATNQYAFLNPGSACWFLNSFNGNGDPLTTVTNTFVGTVQQGALTNSFGPGFNMVSSIVPQTGGIGTVLGLVPTGIQDGQYDGGDAIYLYIAGKYYTYVEDDGYTTPPASPLYWDGPSVTNASTPGNFTSVSGGTYNDPNLPPNQVGVGEIEPIISVGQGFFYLVTGGKSGLSWTRTFSVNN